MGRFVKPLLWSLATLAVLFGLVFSAFILDVTYFVPKNNFTENVVIPAQQGNLEAMKSMEHAYREGYTRGLHTIAKDTKQADYWKSRIEAAERNHKE